MIEKRQEIARRVLDCLGDLDAQSIHSAVGLADVCGKIGAPPHSVINSIGFICEGDVICCSRAGTVSHSTLLLFVSDMPRDVLDSGQVLQELVREAMKEAESLLRVSTRCVSVASLKTSGLSSQSDGAA